VLERLEVLVGRAGVILADAARRVNAELVVLGGKPHGAVARGLGGSTAQYLVRTLDVPLLVTGPTDRPMSRVLVAVDLSYASRPTLQAARRLADRLGARLRVLHVVEPTRSPVGAARSADPEAPARTAAKILRRLVEAEPGVGGAEPVVRQGPAAEEIVAEAASWGADVIVMGSHGKGWVDRLLVGSATERLLAALPTALLVVPVYPARHDRAARPGRKRHTTRRREPYASR
jgi:nucleotide-binding universal stress UspA family protein